jgi:hypothetical protein
LVGAVRLHAVDHHDPGGCPGWLRFFLLLLCSVFRLLFLLVLVLRLFVLVLVLHQLALLVVLSGVRHVPSPSRCNTSS